ncbi:MAG: DNA-binding protein [Leptospirales bacterium]
MRIPAVTYNDVACAAAMLVARHEYPSIRSVHAHLGRGSFTTLAKHLETWRKETTDGSLESKKLPISQDFRRILVQEISRHVQQSVTAKSEEVGRLAHSLREALVENARLACQIEEREKEEARKEQRIIHLEGIARSTSPGPFRPEAR